ncbi:hypothetical protein [Agrobacterium tumefaciens]|jgi:hypothetical protein|uniref:hypothetical protein n=1 Tax=Agrobacterium tumefaciens TaxID=358 RepID=UPI000DD89511|nr:hypothetical protein [Agrobacterium tumefaciens]AYM09003.1 hypothetical protein At1D1460_47620 [Agrobacterium tumefaciens]NSZ35794.1 hypothetical protein [Agrobacterium tumefaciens]QLG25438.1 hypothetical protein EML4_24010 [Agrobacterium tumefaciens]UXS89309.1 hypothetical protein FY144_23950 [Agrobacterium tumefaciens]
MPGALTSCREAPPSVPASFEAALARLLDGYVDGNFGGRAWGVTVKRSQDLKRTWLYGEELGGTDIVSFNFYRLIGSGPMLKPCEMSSAKVIEFVLGFEPSTRERCGSMTMTEK